MKQFKNVEIIKNENEAIKPNSLYILPLDSEKCELFIVDKNRTRVKVKNREIDNYSLKLTKEFSLIPSKSNGDITSPIPSTKANVYKDGNLESQWTFKATFYNCVGSIDSLSGNVNVSILTGDNGSVDIIAEKGGNSPLYTSYIITKVKAGTNGENGDNSNGALKSIAFIRSNSIPSIPTGGSWNSPIPTTNGWSDGIPSGNKPIYMSTRIFTMNGESPQQPLWSIPRLLSDTKDIDFEFSSLLLNPSDPTLNPENWYNDAREDSIWMAIRKFSNGNWGSWSVSKIKGEKGEEGEKGNYPEQRFAKNGSYTTPPEIDVNQSVPSGWTIKPPTLNSLEILWMTIATKKGSDNSLIGTWSVPVRSTGERGDQGVPGPKGDVGPKGDKGDTGPVSDLFVAPRGSWKNTVQYIGDSKRVEAVIYNGVWYVSRTDAGIIPIGTLPTNPQYWNVADRTFDFIATGIFLAEAAYIENLGVRNLKTNDSGTRLEINESDNSLSFYSGSLVSPAIRLTSLNSGSTEYVNGAFINVTGRTSANTIVSSAGIGTNGIISSAFDIGFATKYLGGDIGSVQTGNTAIYGYYNKSGGNPGGFRDKFVGIAGENIEGKTDLDSKMYGGYIDKLLVTSIYYSGNNITNSGTVNIQPNTGLIAHSSANTTLVLPSLNDSIYSMEITLLKLDSNTVTLNSTKNITFDSTTNTSVNLNTRGKYSIYFINNSYQVFKSAL
ncbi:collagen-like triple helix repeat-containing protein [Elizabethkingia bruuniana]|uniref:collagen-like triple helix repeat-containing protein n=1 Tax=Elizabethkingia bruuniana TaxID=1756149 RepID=UPI00099975D2|nr:collagen-like protein [Elizabethkingia bruuniana]OPC53411.1 hypothetical protein BAY07_15275 [Elizabethkingia bruuniana]